MRFFRSMIIGGLGLFALAACSMPASAANDWPMLHEITLQYDEAALVMVDVAIIAEYVVLTSTDPVLNLSGDRSIGELKPEYMASYQTHSLNFIEVRSRCVDCR
jgi:hypothetical protein